MKFAARNVMLAQDSKLHRATTRDAKAQSASSIESPHKPDLDEMGIAVTHEVKPARTGSPRSKMGRPGMRGGFKRGN